VQPRRVTALALSLALLLAACGDGGDEEGPVGQGEGDEEVVDDADDVDDAEEGAAEDETDEPEEPNVDPAEVGANELGEIPVLMYHQLTEGGGSEWDMDPDEFRAELEYLFDEGYVPVTVRDLARGDIDVPAGTTPVVLTFDDSTRSQAYLTEDGEIHPDSSIGILVDVASEYEDVEPVASIYVISGSLFGGGSDGEEILETLHDMGMEIGNHSHTHPSLASLSDERVREELGRNVEVVTDVVDDAEVATLSLPLGQFPQNESLAISGEWEGTSYEHEGVLLVGYDPSPSPFDAEFDPAAIRRIQTHPDPDFEFGSTWWLDVLAANDGARRYVSDGNPDTISFPEELADQLADEHEDRANPY
jgi:peptidoglycan/xylan/chitin deacetylase (PgdA/CDA1 family)